MTCGLALCAGRFDSAALRGTCAAGLPALAVADPDELGVRRGQRVARGRQLGSSAGTRIGEDPPERRVRAADDPTGHGRRDGPAAGQDRREVVHTEIGRQVDVQEHLRTLAGTARSAEQQIHGDVGSELIQRAGLVRRLQGSCGPVDASVSRSRLLGGSVVDRQAGHAGVLVVQGQPPFDEAPVGALRRPLRIHFRGCVSRGPADLGGVASGYALLERRIDQAYVVSGQPRRRVGDLHGAVEVEPAVVHEVEHAGKPGGQCVRRRNHGAGTVFGDGQGQSYFRSGAGCPSPAHAQVCDRP